MITLIWQWHNGNIHRKMSIITWFRQLILLFNSLWPGDSIGHHKTWLILAQAMAFCLTAPSNYQIQWWLSIDKVLWQSCEAISIEVLRNVDINHSKVLENTTFKTAATSLDIWLQFWMCYFQRAVVKMFPFSYYRKWPTIQKEETWQGGILGGGNQQFASEGMDKLHQVNRTSCATRNNKL